MDWEGHEKGGGSENFPLSPMQVIPDKTRQHYRKPGLQAPITSYGNGMCQQVLVMKSRKILQ